MGIFDWDKDPGTIKEKLAKAYGPRSAQTGAAETSEPKVTYQSGGVALNIGSDRKAEIRAKLDEFQAKLNRGS